MKKFWTKTLVAGALAGCLVASPMAAYAQEQPSKPDDEKSQEQRDAEEKLQSAEAFGWILISITSELIYGPGAFERAIQDSANGGHGGTGHGHSHGHSHGGHGGHGGDGGGAAQEIR